MIDYCNFSKIENRKNGNLRVKGSFLYLFVFIILIFSPAITFGQEILPVRFGLLPVIDTLPLLVADEKGLFGQRGLQVEFISFNSALERDAALVSNALDGYFGDLLNTILLVSKGSNLKIVSSVCHTSPQQRMFALLSAPQSGINSLEQLGSNPIAVSKASIIEYFLDEILTANNIPLPSIQKMEIRAIPIRYQMLMGNTVRLALLPEPLASKAVSEGATVLADDRTIDTTATIIALNAALLKAHPQLGKQFLEAYAESVRLINENPSDYKNILVNRTRFPITLKNRYPIPHFPAPQPPSRNDVSRVEGWLLANGLLKEILPYEKLIWGENNKNAE